MWSKWISKCCYAYCVAIVFSLNAYGYLGEGIKQRIVPQGEIANSSKNTSTGVVMLLDRQRGKNVFVKIGETIPGTSYKVLRVERDCVVVSNGAAEVRLLRDKFGNEGGGESNNRRYGFQGRSAGNAGDADDDENSDDRGRYAGRKFAPATSAMDNAPPPPVPYDSSYDRDFSQRPAPSPGYDDDEDDF